MHSDLDRRHRQAGAAGGLLDRQPLDLHVLDRQALPVGQSGKQHAQIAPLAASQLESDRALVRFCDGLDEAALARPVRMHRGEDEGVIEEALPAALAHLFVHQTHHRGQAHAMLAGTRVAPPQLDEFFCANEAHLRADELAAIGLSEDAIWGSRQR